MHKFAGCLLGLLLPVCLWGQQRTFAGINLAPLLINTLDIKVERQITPILNLELGAGFRYQNLGQENTPKVSLLSDYITNRNQGMFFSAGGRIFNNSANPYEFPYIALNLVGSWYQDQVFDPKLNPTVPITYQGWRLGGTFTLGFVIFIHERLYADLGLQIGYTPMREDLLAYYLGGMGYTTFGPNRFSIEGAHFQPIITLKYEIRRDKRARLRDQP